MSIPEISDERFRIFDRKTRLMFWSMSRGALAGIFRRDRRSQRRSPPVRQAGKANIIFAAAPSQNEFFVGLVADNVVDWTRVTASLHG